jgi:hypothetical protein
MELAHFRSNKRTQILAALEPFDFWVGGHDLDHESGHEFGLHAIFRKISAMVTTSGDRDRDQRSQRFFWQISGVIMTRFHDRQQKARIINPGLFARRGTRQVRDQKNSYGAFILKLRRT